MQLQGNLSAFTHSLHEHLIGPLTFSDLYKILHNVALYGLLSVLASWIMLPQLSNFQQPTNKKLSPFHGSNLHLINNFIPLI